MFQKGPKQFSEKTFLLVRPTLLNGIQGSRSARREHKGHYVVFVVVRRALRDPSYDPMFYTVQLISFYSTNPVCTKGGSHCFEETATVYLLLYL